jgi:hypothetical protein
MREARSRIEKINPHAVGGGSILVSEFMKGSFVSGLKDDRVKYIVKARGEEVTSSEETALQEESEIKSQRFKGNLAWAGPGYSGNYGRELRPQVKREVCATSIRCYKCQGAGHFAKHCSEKPVCTKCQRGGHIARDCRVRKFQGNL